MFESVSRQHFAVGQQEHYSAFCHLILQLEFVSEAHWSHVLPSCCQDSWPAADRSICGREVKAMGLKFIGVSLRRFENYGWYCPFALVYTAGVQVPIRVKGFDVVCFFL